MRVTARAAVLKFSSTNLTRKDPEERASTLTRFSTLAATCLVRVTLFIEIILDIADLLACD